MKDILVLLVLLISQLTQVCPQPYQADSNGNCRNASREYPLEGSNLCCKKCQPGHRLLHECSQSTDTVCTECESGLYMENWNYAPTCSSCIKCSQAKGLQYDKTCSATARSRCICLPGMYCDLQYDEQHCQHCQKYKLCKPGYGVVAEGTPKSNVKCKRCAPGTFSDTESSTDRCQNHTKCEGRTVREGNATSDTVCQPKGFTSRTQTQTPTKKHQAETELPSASTMMHPTSGRGLTDYSPSVIGTQSTTKNPTSEHSNTAAIAGVTGGIMLLLSIVCLLSLYKAIFKKDAVKLYPKVDANGNCERGDEINHGFLGETQLTSFTVTSPEQQCMLEKGEASSIDHSQCSNNSETLTRTEGCSTNESIGPLQSTVALNNFPSALSEPMPLISNLDPLTPQPSIPTPSSSQPTSPQIISPVTTSPHVNVNITFHIGNGSCGAQPAIPTDLRLSDCKIPFGEEDESFSIPQQEDGKQSLMSVQESTESTDYCV
ncbi:hypothetical protein Q5P01_001484 [Channa striata]|uniref:TNFR-Cys domain-containing protein n=1 Tax=Channa striata TaxID=64152 RepID=A0AA88NKT2_CHASR|nr:hypothetical protein Q5P01_001484 [Channa striata]